VAFLFSALVKPLTIYAILTPMAQTPEKKVKDKVVKILKENEVYYFFPATYGMGRSGVPDIICCVNGRFLAIECKAGDNKPTVLQQRELKAIADAGGSALVVNELNVEGVASVVRILRDHE
jgi:Holliday junction resolvase